MLKQDKLREIDWQAELWWKILKLLLTLALQIYNRYRNAVPQPEKTEIQGHKIRPCWMNSFALEKQSEI